MDNAYDALLMADYDCAAVAAASSPIPSSPRNSRNSKRLELSQQGVGTEDAPATSPRSRQRRQGDLWLRSAWVAVRRAAAAALSGLEDETQDDNRDVDWYIDSEQMINSRCAKRHREGENADNNGIGQSKEEVNIDASREWRLDWSEIELSDVTTTSSMGDSASRRQSTISSIPDDVYDQKSFEANFETRLDRCVDAEYSSRRRDQLSVTPLCRQFRGDFERNGGTHCLTQLRQLADSLLLGMRDPSSQAAAQVAEFENTKTVLDDALNLLDYSRRKDLDESSADLTEAAGMAQAIIGENAKEDACRLLAVLAAKSCASIVKEVEREDDWEGRVKGLVDVARIGVEKIRIISRKLEMEEVGKEAVRVVLAGGALGIAVLQIEAVGKALGDQEGQ